MIDTNRILGLCRTKVASFIADQSGAVLPIVTISLVVLMGMATLATDLSRLLDLQTQLQKAADAYALAGAAELDGAPDAITRANAAIDTMMASRNSSIFGGGAVTVASRTYYATLPANDATAMGGGGAAAADARYVQVVVTPVVLNTFLPATYFGAVNNTMTTGASAVAGLMTVLCRKTPIYVCNGSGPTDMLDPTVMRGKEVVLVAPPGSAFAPGNYGFLDIGCGNNTPCLNEALGKNESGQCTRVDTVDTTTGQKSAAADYFNTRFDIYDKSAKNANPAEYSPDVNVRKGYVPGADACKDQKFDETGTQSLPLPDDSDITPAIKNGTNPYIGNRDVIWGNYSDVNNVPRSGTTRYDQYKSEIGLDTPSDGGEKGTPICAPANATAERRLIYAAVLDCSALSGGVNEGVHALGVVTFFLLRPNIETGGFGTMLGEYVDVAVPESGKDILHDIVQLYR
jgi:Flp pilus assembly protein TadG